MFIIAFQFWIILFGQWLYLGNEIRVILRDMSENYEVNGEQIFWSKKSGLRFMYFNLNIFCHEHALFSHACACVCTFFPFMLVLLLLLYLLYPPRMDHRNCISTAHNFLTDSRGLFSMFIVIQTMRITTTTPIIISL